MPFCVYEVAEGLVEPTVPKRQSLAPQAGLKPATYCLEGSCCYSTELLGLMFSKILF